MSTHPKTEISKPITTACWPSPQDAGSYCGIPRFCPPEEGDPRKALRFSLSAGANVSGTLRGARRGFTPEHEPNFARSKRLRGREREGAGAHLAFASRVSRKNPSAPHRSGWCPGNRNAVVQASPALAIEVTPRCGGAGTTPADSAARSRHHSGEGRFVRHPQE